VIRSKRPSKNKSEGSSHADNDVFLFHQAVSGATPLRPSLRIQRQPDVRRRTKKASPDQSIIPAKNVTGSLDLNQNTDWAEEGTYLRSGLQRDTIRKLRRGHWTSQDTIDLHGASREEASQLLAALIESCRIRGIRCAKIIHGKGLRSPDKSPVIRGLLRGWLVQNKDVLAYCEAPVSSGGSGATLVLIASK